MQALAHVATIGLLQERAIRRGEVLAEQLQSALNSRIVIEQAKGAIAQSRNVSVDDAFVIMRDNARRTGTHLVVVAQSVTHRPGLPRCPVRRGSPDPIDPGPGDRPAVSPTEAAAKRRRGEDLEALLGRARRPGQRGGGPGPRRGGARGSGRRGPVPAGPDLGRT